MRDTIDMAREAGMLTWLKPPEDVIERFKAFEALVRADERALAAPVQEPVAWGVFEGNLHDMFFSQTEADHMACLKGAHAEVRPLYTTPPAAQPAPVQEPVAVTYKEVADTMNALWGGTLVQVQIAMEMANRKLYTTPPAQRQWVGLTEEEIWKTISRIGTSDSDVNPYAKLADARTIEAKLKEKNNG